VLKRQRDPAAAAQTQAMMERQVGSLTRLIDDLLDVSRIDSGKLELRLERVALDAVVRAAVETALPGIEAMAHRLSVHYPGQPVWVDADSVRLAQVVGNLLNNAAKFTPHGGRIELTLRAEERHAVIEVADNGVGIAAENLQRIFDMFVQVDAARAGTGGLGLGLTLVRSIVERHGGTVQARSAGRGAGARFVVRIPLAPAGAAMGRPEDSGAPRACRRVLVVDDNVDAAISLAQLLRSDGHLVDVAHDGTEALRLAGQSPPEIAFVDVDMPGMDGLEVARRLRAAPGTASSCLVALTGMGQPADIARTHAAGFDVHITKPAEPQRVLQLAALLGEAENVLRLRGSRAGESPG
jgi:CheY-like chemotaxis protein